MTPAHLAPALLLLSAVAACASPTMSPNVLIAFECDGCDVRTMEDKFFEFVSARGLKAINKARYIKDHGKTTPFSTEVIGYSDDKLIELRKFGYYNNRYLATIQTMPPSNPATSDSTDLKSFVDGIQHIKIIEIRFAENPTSAAETFSAFLKTYKGWADQMARGASE